MTDTSNQKLARVASGRFVLRIESGLHATLRQAAASAGLSLNDYCARKLASPVGNLGSMAAARAVAQAGRLFGDRLLGLAAFGSWARSEMGPRSDVDLLIVLQQGAEISRDLYRRWDESPLHWDGHPLEPHFVHPPRRDGRTGGVWPEVALDGVVLFERALMLSRWLVQIRRQIVAGRIVRKVVHGQPYWVEVA